MLIMSLDEWQLLTEIKFKIRSKQLRAVDRALKDYQARKTPADLKELKYALFQWKMSVGFGDAGGRPQWQADERNQRQGIVRLDNQILTALHGLSDPSVLADSSFMPFHGVAAWAETQPAAQALIDAQREALAEMFQGRKLQPRGGAYAEFLVGLKVDAEEAESNGAKLPATVTAMAAEKLVPYVKEVLSEVLGGFPEEVIRDCMALLSEVPGLLLTIAHSFVPYFAVVVAGGQTIKNGYSGINKALKSRYAGQHVTGFAPGDATAAAEAVSQLLRRQATHYGRITTIHAADTVASAGILALDAAAHGAPAGTAVLGPLKGLTKALAMIAEKVFLMGRDFYERYQANKILTDPSQIRLTHEIFDTCPLLGAYFVANATTSYLVNFTAGDIGSVGFVSSVDTLVKAHIAPMVKYAREVIRESRMEVAGMENMKGQVSNTSPGITHAKARAISALQSKLRSILPFVEKPEPPPVMGAAQPLFRDGKQYGGGFKRG
jgi:hypothetical protein